MIISNNIFISIGSNLRGHMNNSKDIMNLNSVDGVLVGGASLNSIEFNKIINA